MKWGACRTSSGGDALVVMVEPADLWGLGHASIGGGLSGSGLRSVHLRRLMNTPPVVVGEVVRKNPLRVPRRYCPDVDVP
jgi:hypothetical protein